MTAALPLDALTDDDDTTDYGRPVSIDIHDLWLHLRGLGAPRWSEQLTEAAYHRLNAALDGDVRTAVAYLEHLARRNTYLWRWLANVVGNDELRYTAVTTIGRHPEVEYPPLRVSRFAPLTLHEILTDAILARGRHDLIVLANRAQDSGLYGPHTRQPRIYDGCCDDIFELQTLLLSHLPTRDKPRVRLDDEPDDVGIHPAGCLREATDNDERRAVERADRSARRTL